MVNQIKATIDKKTGKVVLKGTVDEERDFEPILKKLPEFRQQVEDLREQVKTQEKQLAENEPVIFDGEIEKFIELSKKVQRINQRANLEKDLETKKKQLAESEKVLKENEDLAEQYKTVMGAKE